VALHALNPWLWSPKLLRRHESKTLRHLGSWDKLGLLLSEPLLIRGRAHMIPHPLVTSSWGRIRSLKNRMQRG